MGDVERAERINAAVDLLESGVPTAEAVGVLAERLAVSPRQARRYVDQAARGGRVEVPEASVVFTVKLPASLANGVHGHARETGVTISAVVAKALSQFLRGRRERPQR